MATGKVLFWLGVPLLAAFLMCNGCFGAERPSGYGVDEIKMCTPSRPCITDSEGPTEVESAYRCGWIHGLKLLLESHRKHAAPEPQACRALDDKYGDWGE